MKILFVPLVVLILVACCGEERTELSDAASAEAAAPAVYDEAAAREEGYWAEKPSDNP